MTLGYIVTDRIMKGIDGFVEQVKDVQMADSTKPILIVGWEKAKAMPQYTSILERKLDENLYWTFGKTESRQDLEIDLQRFYKLIYDKVLSKIRYYYINVINIKYNKIKKLIEYIYSPIDKHIYVSGEMVYISYMSNGILGISLTILEYCGIQKAKVMKKLAACRYNHIIEANTKYLYKLKKVLANKKYAVPYFMRN